MLYLLLYLHCSVSATLMMLMYAYRLTQHGSLFHSGELDEVLLKLLQGQPDGW